MNSVQNEKSENSKEVKVNTVEDRECGGKGQEQRDIEIIQQLHQTQPGKPATSGSLLTGAAVSVVGALQSAREVLSADRG
ncbi:hypothetical protein RND81_13G195000 [Saponaria officinalis]|uniref:Uncharacterized protein n=1 Tax=Saponaria officinalis TaxID=3572 RepID=A0AAW1H6V0_SAPOF